MLNDPYEDYAQGLSQPEWDEDCARMVEDILQQLRRGSSPARIGERDD